MQGQDLARFLVGIVGNVISGFLFLSPTPTFWRIIKKKSTEEFHPYPYIACVMNCSLWIFYGLPIVHPDSTLVVTINSAGLFLELCYLSIFFFYTAKKKYRWIIILMLLGEAVLLAVVVVITLVCFHTHHNRSMFVGLICVVFGIVMYAAPLSIIRKVIKTKSAEFMPFWVCLACFLNGACWFTYANLKSFDLYIATGNGIGGILGFIQLSIYGYYTLKTKTKGSVQSDAKPGDVQLTNNAATKTLPV